MKKYHRRLTPLRIELLKNCSCLTRCDYCGEMELMDETHFAGEGLGLYQICRKCADNWDEIQDKINATIDNDLDVWCRWMGGGFR